MIQNFYSKQKPKISWLRYIFADKKYRGKNIASGLFKMSIEKLKKMGKDELITDVYAKNAESLNFFRHQDFGNKEKWFNMSRKLNT